MTATEKLARELYEVLLNGYRDHLMFMSPWDWRRIDLCECWKRVARHVLRREAKLKHSLRRCYTRLAVKPGLCGLDEGAMEEAERILRRAKR